MNKHKRIFLYIFFAIIISSKALAQNAAPDTAETDIDTTVKSELDIKYDSVLSKAALALGASAYTDAIASYKEASALKPANVYPYKMIIYAEDLAFKQKRADELKRKAKIRDDLSKANNEIAVKSWDSARLLFNEVLSLNPEKTDQEYAKSKIDAIDLELARIAARIPPKPAPVVVVVPKNRHEARAMRKIAERNAKLPPALVSPAAHAQTQIPVQASNTTASTAVQQKPAATAIPQNATVAPATNQTAQKPTNTAIPQRTVEAPVTNQTATKPAETSIPQKTLTAAPTTNRTVLKPAETPAPQKTMASATVTNQTAQNPTETPAPQKTVASAPVTNQAAQKPVETLVPQKTLAAPATNQAVLKSAETPAPQKTVAAAPATNQTALRPTETPAPQKTLAAPATNQTILKPAETSLPQKPVTAPPATNQTVSKSAETPAPQKTEAAAPATNQTVLRPTETSLTALSPIILVDSSDYVKLTCQDISFIGANAYIKVLIQNYSTTANFPTDTLQVSIKKNNGIIKKLDQRFISSFPVITPLNESVFVSFADASGGIDPDDIFILEMRNKIKKTKFALQIPWSVYQQQKNL